MKSKTCFYQSFFIFKEIATVEFHYKIISKVNLEVYFTCLTKNFKWICQNNVNFHRKHALLSKPDIYKHILAQVTDNNKQLKLLSLF